MARKKPQIWQQVQDPMTKRALQEMAEVLTEGSVPSGTLIIWDQGPTCPIGYQRDDTYAGVFPRAAGAGKAPGSTGGAATATTSTNSGGGYYGPGSGGYISSVDGHTHTVSTLPPYKEVLFCRKI